MGDKDFFMNLTLVPGSDEAIKLTDTLVGELWDGAGTRKAPSNEFGQAIGAIIGALIQSAARDKSAYLFRPIGKDRFAFEDVGYRAFKRATDRLEHEGYLAIQLGSDRGDATKFRAMPKLLDLAEAAGLDVRAWSEHYSELPRPQCVPSPLVLKASSWADYVEQKGRVKRRGAAIPINMSREPAKTLGAQVNAINKFLAGVRIDPPGSHWAFQRVFNRGDIAGFNWNKGGRLVSMGSSYQNTRRENRPNIRIDEHRTVEIDVRASHLTVLHALLGKAFDLSHDPYEIEGYPRYVVKRWVTATLGHDRYPGLWSKDAKSDYVEEKVGTGKLQKDFPIKQTGKALLPHIPILQDWETCSIRWGDLQYFESRAVVGAVHELATLHQVPALPVHDSIIVREGDERLARDVLTDNFRRHVGVDPFLTIK